VEKYLDAIMSSFCKTSFNSETRRSYYLTGFLPYQYYLTFIKLFSPLNHLSLSKDL
jgi:hypothetical protein